MKPPQRVNLFSEPVHLSAYSAKIELYQPRVGRKRSLRESHDSDGRSDDVTPPLNRFATDVAAIGADVAPRFAKPPEPVVIETVSSLYCKNARTSRTRASNSSG